MNVSEIYALLPWVEDANPLDLARSGAIVLAGLVATHHSSRTWINSQVVLLTSAALAFCSWPGILLKTAIDQDAVDEKKLFFTRYIGLLIGAYVLFMYLNRRTRDNRVWFSVFLAGTLVSVILVWTQINGGKLFQDSSNVHHLTSKFVLFPAMALAIFFHGNLWHLMWFDDNQPAPYHVNHRMNMHVVVDLMLQMPSLVLGLCYPHVLYRTMSLGNEEHDSFDIYLVQSITAVKFALFILSLLTLNFSDQDAKRNFLLTKCLLMTSLCLLMAHLWLTLNLVDMTPLMVAIVPLAISGLNAAWGWQVSEPSTT